MSAIARDRVPAGAFAAAARAALDAEAARATDTPLRELPLPEAPGVTLWLKDESAHPSGSLKHRLARNLVREALDAGRLAPHRALIDASSGSTAISEAWFARLLGLRCLAVMPRGTAPGKQRAVRELGGECVMVDPATDIRAAAQALALEHDACFLDQFGRAGLVRQAPGTRDLATETLAQLAGSAQPSPNWFVCGAGTGGTSASIGRALRAAGLATRVCVAEPENTAFARGFLHCVEPRCAPGSLIEGVGRRCVEPGFAFDLVDRVIELADLDSIGGCHALAARTGTRYGGSSGLVFVAALALAREMRARGETGSIVAVLGDGGERYRDTIYDTGWLASQRAGT